MHNVIRYEHGGDDGRDSEEGLRVLRADAGGARGGAPRRGEGARLRDAVADAEGRARARGGRGQEGEAMKYKIVTEPVHKERSPSDYQTIGRIPVQAPNNDWWYKATCVQMPNAYCYGDSRKEAVKRLIELLPSFVDRALGVVEEEGEIP